MKLHHHNSSLLLSLVLTLAFALFGLGGAPVAASVPPDALAATATRTPTRAPSKATPTPARRLVAAGDPPLTAPSSLILQNLDPNASMHARLSYYDGLSGQLLLQKTAQTILPARNLWISQSSQTGLATTFSGNALVDSDTPFGMVVVESNGLAGTLGKNFKMDAYTGWLSTWADTQVLLAQVIKNTYDAGTGLTFNSTLVLQNTSPTQAANVTLRYKASTGEEYVHSDINLLPSASTTIDVPTDSTLQGVTSFYGSARLTATQPVVALAYNGSAYHTYVCAGLPGAFADNTLYLPQLLKNVYDSPSGFTFNGLVQAMTTDGTPADFTLTYRSSTGTAYVETKTNKSIAIFDLRYSTALPYTFYGSGSLTANKAIVGTAFALTNNDPTRGIRESARSQTLYL